VKIFYVSVLCLIVSLSAGRVMAQSTNAAITGRVTDPTKAVIGGAQVAAVNTGTNVRYEAATNGTGSYVIPDLPPGPYRVEVEKPGFKTIVETGVVLHVQDTVELNFELAVGAVAESVTVSADQNNMNTTDGSVSTVVDRQFAENLPLNGRSFQTLIQLTPGVVLVASNASDGGQFSVNGQRAASNYWMVDGVSANIGVSSIGPGNGTGGTLGSFSALGGTSSLVSVDALQEFRIQTSTYAPEFGRTPGGQISIVTRSGTNQFHGTLFDYFRNNVLDANNWFANSAGLPRPEERQNDFGGTFSGPIVKDRTFFFFSYEGLRLRLPETALTSVPDLLARQNAVPAMQPYLNAFPVPNGPEILDAGGNPTGAAQDNASFSDKATLDAYSIRIDQKLSNRLSLFGRYNYSPSELLQRGDGSSLNNLQSNTITTQTATVGATWAISPTVANDLRFNYSRVTASSAYSLDNFGGAVPLTSLPFPTGFTSQNSLFALSIINSALTASGFGSGQAAQNLQRQINVVDNFSVQRGSHSLKFGLDLRRLSPLTAPSAYAQGVYFPDVPSVESGISELGFAESNSAVTLLFHNLAIFAQDTWRVVPRLTLTYGLRWDVDFAPSSLNGPSIPSVTGYNMADFSQLALAPAGTAPFKTTYGNFAPRIGIAYQINQSQDWMTVLRGGFGVFYDLVSSEAGNALNTGAPPFTAFNPFSGTFPFTAAQIAAPTVQPASLADLYAFNPNLKLPYTLEWNVALEQALGKQQTISASYVGANGTRLLQTSFVASPPTNPNLGAGVFIDNTAASEYDALQIQFQRRLSHGLQALASYTWSHSIDDGSAGSIFLTSNVGTPGSNSSTNRGPSDFDIRHAASAAVTYDVPWPEINTFANEILRDWSIEDVIQARSAPPVDVSDANFFFLSGGIRADVRPDLVPGQPLYLYGSQYPGGKAFNPAAFTNPPVDPSTGDPVRQGNVPRNFLRGFGAAEWDFGVHRDFPIHESLHLQFRAEVFNLLNHPNFGPPNGQFGAGGFGLSTQTLGQSLNGGPGGNLGGGAFSPLYQIGGPRSIQLALKLMF
jgi:hypothetical protein